VTTELFAEEHATRSPDADAARKPFPLAPSPCSQRGARRDGRSANARGGTFVDDPVRECPPIDSFEDTSTFTTSEEAKGGSNGFPFPPFPPFNVAVEDGASLCGAALSRAG
jgi:hypothetical protein